MNSRLAGVVALGALLAGVGAAVEVSRRPGLVTQTAPDGGVWLRLAPGSPEAQVPLVVGHRGGLRATDGGGRRLDLGLRLLEAGRERRTSGVLVSRELLEQGLWQIGRAHV